MKPSTVRVYSQGCASEAGVLIDAVPGLDGEEIFAFGADEVGTVDREQRLAAMDVLVGRIREHLLDPSREARLHVCLQSFVGLDISGGLQTIVDFPLHNGGEFEADQLPALRRYANGRERGIRSPRHRAREEKALQRCQNYLESPF